MDHKSSVPSSHIRQQAWDGMDSSTPMVFQVGNLGPDYWVWVHKPDSGQPRFFEHWLLEACSKTPWWVVPLIWLPLFSACFWHAHTALGVPAVLLVTWLMAGVVAWQLMEYVMHRVVFHAHIPTYWGITFHFLFHGCHHKYPMDRLRLVFPPVPASAVIASVYVSLHTLLPREHALPLFAGMGFGYVAYDCLHYFLHHHGPRLPGPLLQDLRQRHTHHHYKDCTKDFGISSALFDVVFCSGS